MTSSPNFHPRKLSEANDEISSNFLASNLLHASNQQQQQQEQQLQQQQQQQQQQPQTVACPPPLLTQSSSPFQSNGIPIMNFDNLNLILPLPSQSPPHRLIPSLPTSTNVLAATSTNFQIQQLLSEYQSSAAALASSINQLIHTANAPSSQTHIQQPSQQTQSYPSHFHADIPNSINSAVRLNASNSIALHIKELADKGKEFQQRLIVSQSQLLELQNFFEFLVICGTAFLNRRLSVNEHVTTKVSATAANLSQAIAHNSSSSSIASSAAAPHVPVTNFPSTASFSLTTTYLPLTWQPVRSPLEDLRCCALRLETQGRHADALSYWKIAYNQGDAYALYRIGNRYWWAWGFKYDDVRASDLWLRSAQAGHSSGLARCHFFGLGNFRKDEARAFQLYLTLAEQGDLDSINQVGAYYEGGNGVQKDEKKAVQYYRLGAEKSHSVAQYNLANSYMNGRGVDQDENKAVYYYHISAESGIVKAQYALGLIYEEGIVVRKDREEALKWYHRAAAMGYSEALKKTGILTAEVKNLSRRI